MKELGIGLRANDPLFDQKMPLLTPAIEVIQQSLPPSQWKQAIHNAYLRLPAGAVAALLLQHRRGRRTTRRAPLVAHRSQRR